MKAFLSTCLLLLSPFVALADVNSGSDGSDGVFSPTQNVTIDMGDHPDGIYQYTSVNIPSGVTVTFKANDRNSPVVWLVQGNCSIAGKLCLDAEDRSSATVLGGKAGPGGYPGGSGALDQFSLPGGGLGPGGGTIGTDLKYNGANASFATVGACSGSTTASGHPPQFAAGQVYGNSYCVPLLGGSGGSGGRDVGGGGGGGSLLIAASGTVTISASGAITAKGGRGYYDIPGWGFGGGGGAGSGGSVRIVATTIAGNGSIDVRGGSALYDVWNNYPYGAGFSFNDAGLGRIRLDGLNVTYNGGASGAKTTGFQPIIIPPSSQAASLCIESVAGIALPANPSGQLTMPDVTIPALQQNPVPMVVRCANLPLNTEIVVDIKPATGTPVRAVGTNNVGSVSSSTATLSVNMPRGGGTIQATCISSLAGISAAAAPGQTKNMPIALTGWTAGGERFAKVELVASMGAKTRVAYITDSGKRYAWSN